MVEGRDRTDQVRRYMRHPFSVAVHSEPWEATDRDVATLTSAALKKVRVALADEAIQDPGPSSLELAVRGAYALAVSGLNADRETVGNTGISDASTGSRGVAPGRGARALPGGGNSPRRKMSLTIWSPAPPLPQRRQCTRDSDGGS